MRDVLLITGGLLLILAGFVVFRPRKVMAGDMDAPMNVERSRARSGGVVPIEITEADVAEAAPLVAFVEEIGTDELPIVHQVRRRRTIRRPSRRQLRAARLRAARAFAADPFAAVVPDWRRLAAPVDFEEQAGRWFAPAVESRTFPERPAEPVYDLESFTESWTRADVDRMVADYEAREAANR